MKLFKIADFGKGHLPLMVISAVAIGGAWLILTTHIQTQVAYVVGIVNPVHMVDTLVAGKRSPEVFSHNPSVFKNLPSTLSHGVEPVEFGIGHGVFTEDNISGRQHSSPAWIVLGAERSHFRLGAPARAAASSEVFVRCLMANCSDWYPSGLQTDWASNPSGRAYMAAVLARNYLAPVNGRMLREVVHTSRSSHSETLHITGAN